MAATDTLRPNCSRGHGDSMFRTDTDGWRCAVCLTIKENEMQTYIFTVAVTGEDVQDAAEALREGVIDIARVQQDGSENDVHVTDTARVTP